MCRSCVLHVRGVYVSARRRCLICAWYFNTDQRRMKDRTDVSCSVFDSFVIDFDKVDGLRLGQVWPFRE
jgi:hypothetical protein